MPKLRQPGGGRRCLLLSVGSADTELSPALASLGFVPVDARGEAEGLARLSSEAFAVAFVGATTGAARLSGICARAASLHPEVPVVAVGRTAAVQEAVDAMQSGAADYIYAPILVPELSARLVRLLARSEVLSAQRTSAATALSVPGFVGSSPAIQRLLGAIDKISRYKTNVLILGESGTGKELIARALHTRGPRRQHLFVPLNCATLGRDLLENELFGHEKGAFTGANEKKKGLFELADGGSLFLDEIGEMDLSTQAKLLRVLERSEFRRVGGTGKVHVDLSIIAATNRKLEDAIKGGKFREDLYYRLKVITLVIAPLRERREDIPALIHAFLDDFNRRNGQKIEGISPQALTLLMQHDWPGNVRELKHSVESAAILASGSTIGVDDFPEQQGVAGRAPAGAALERGRDEIVLRANATIADAERALIEHALRRNPTKTEAARTLGIGLRTLYSKLRLYGIDA